MTDSNSTSPDRVVQLTGAGAGAITVVRMSGPSTERFLRAHFSPEALRDRLNYGLLREGEQTLDDVVVALSPDGQSADLNLHGSPWLARRVLELCQWGGFSLVETFDEAGALAPCAADGEDFLEREMLRALPAATTSAAIRMLLSQPIAWRRLIALAEDEPEKFKSSLRAAVDDFSGHWMLHPPWVAIIGIPNSGKSTLANALYGQARSITADVPGTTRDWVADLAEINGLGVLLHDMPGFHETSDPIERDAIALARKRQQSADLIVLVLDAERPDDPDQMSLQRSYPKALKVWNKADRGSDAPSSSGMLKTIATEGVGIDQLRRAIASHFGCSDLAVAGAVWWNKSTRQLLASAVAGRGLLKQAVDDSSGTRR